MPTVITPVRSDNSYFGFAKETVPGTPVAPSIFPRWKDGSKIEIDLAAASFQEGDGSRRTSLVYKSGQKVKIKLVAALRANEMGFFEQASLGAGGDTYTAPTVNTTLSALTTVGATTISVAANTGLTGSGTIALVIGAGLATEEIATFTIPPTGVGPYILTVANSGTLKQAHANGATVKSAALHAITDQSDGDYLTIEVGLGNLFGSGGSALRVRSCKVDSIKRSAEHGGVLMHEVEFTGIASTIQGTPATVVLEQHKPFLFTQSAWTLDGSTTGDALNLRKFEITQKNNVDDDTQTESLTLMALIFGVLEVTASYSLIFTDFSRINLAYFGSTTGTTDSALMGLGALIVTFIQPDTLQSVTFTILTLAYTKVSLPEPKKDGKHYEIDVEGTSVTAPLSGTGANNAYLLQVSFSNTQYSAY